MSVQGGKEGEESSSCFATRRAWPSLLQAPNPGVRMESFQQS